jgi:predicted MFS family arabinose efflux permease
MNARVLALAFGTFAVGTGTWLVSGIVGEVARGLSVSTGAAGQLLTVFAVAYALLSPVLVAATGRVARRRLLVAALVLFALANLLGALAPNYALLLASRVVAVLGAAVFTPVALGVGSGLVPAEGRGRALSAVMGGFTLAWVAGVPAGTLASDAFGWRASFALAAVLAALGAAAVAALIPTQGPVEGTGAPAGLKDRVFAATRPEVLVALSLTVLGLAASFSALTYARPLLEELTGFSAAGVSAAIFFFGLTGLLGTWFGGYAADRFDPTKVFAAIFVAEALSLAAVSVVAGQTTGGAAAIVGTAAALTAWGASSFAILPLNQYRLIAMSPDARSEVLSLNSSAIYLGQGLGGVLGALTLAHASLAGLGWAGAACAAAGLIVLLLGPGPDGRPGAVPPDARDEDLARQPEAAGQAAKKAGAR